MPGKLTYDDLGVPSQVQFDIPGASTQAINAVLADDGLAALIGQSMIVATHDGRQIKTTLTALGRVGFEDGNTIRVDAYVGPSETTSEAAAAEKAAAWHLGLANVGLRGGDEWVEHPAASEGSAGPKGGGRSLSRLRFTVGGRAWTLTDELFRARRAGAKPSIVPVESASLTTPFAEGDTAGGVAAVASDIEQVLRLALSRDVRFVSVSTQGADGTLLTSTSRAVHVQPANVGGSPPIDNWREGVLAGLLEVAQPIVAGDRDWWHRTLGLYWQAQASKYLEIQTSILNILVDRITTRIVGASGGAEIDVDLPARADDASFREGLHALLSTLSSKWSADRTDAVVGKLKEFNAKPSFPNKIRRACDRVGVRAPSGKEMGVRHVLLHLGELNAPGGDAVKYWLNLDALVLTLILRMWGYKGSVYHGAFGPNEVLMTDVLAQ